MKLLAFVIATLSSALCAHTAYAMPSYNPLGAQSNVALATVTGGGWTQCYQATMNVSIGNDASTALANCGDGDLLMMAGRVTGSETLLSLAEGDKTQVLADTGQTSTTHTVNGAEWWFSHNWSWGFTALGDTVNNNQCDTSDSPLSMCLHTLDGVGGYRINNITGLNNSTQYEKLLFVSSSAVTPGAVPEPGTTALLGLGLMGFIAMRRKSAKSKNA